MLIMFLQMHLVQIGVLIHIVYMHENPLGVTLKVHSWWRVLTDFILS